MAKTSFQSVAVVVPNWNSAKRLEKCLTSLLAQSYRDVTIVVVDNGSRDGSVALLERYASQHRQVVVLRNAHNQGFTGGVNPGIRWALSHGFWAVALFNNDAVAREDWLQALAEILSTKPDVSIVTGLLLHTGGKTIDSSGDWLSDWGLPFPRGRGQAAKSAPAAGYVFGASGGASLYRSSLLRTIGLFDDNYFAYYEDMDISFRAQLHGASIYYTPAAVAYHGQGETSRQMAGFTVRQTFRNLPYLLIKNLPWPLVFRVGPRFVLAYGLFLGNALRRGQGKPALKGFLQQYRLLPSAFAWRRDIQRGRTIPLRQLRDMLWPGLPPDQTGLRKFRAFFRGEKV